jgi:hypothetical protein
MKCPKCNIGYLIISIRKDRHPKYTTITTEGDMEIIKEEIDERYHPYPNHYQVNCSNDGECDYLLDDDFGREASEFVEKNFPSIYNAQEENKFSSCSQTTQLTI